MAQQIVTLNPGQSVVIPGNAVINSVVLDGDTTVSSSCGALPTPDTYVCRNFYFSDSEAAASGGAVENGTIVSIEIGGTVYDIDKTLDDTIANIATAINDVMGPLFVVDSGALDPLDERTDYAIRARIPSSLVDTVKFKITSNQGYQTGFYLIAEDNPGCDCATVGTPSETFCLGV